MGNAQSHVPVSQERVFTDAGMGVPWAGSKQHLVVSIDIGATHSAVVVTHLKPNVIPDIYRVSHWPKQEANMSEEKVPSLLQYGDTLDVPLLAVGAEVQHQQKHVRYFKLHIHAMHPPTGDFNLNSLTPKGLEDLDVDLVRIYTDFMRYLMEHTKKRLAQVAGFDLWSENFNQVEVVLTHPNLWDRDQRRILQNSAVGAGLISSQRAQEHIHFVEEAQAAARYCLSKYSTTFGDVTPGSRITVCDAGGSTVDITTYDLTSSDHQVVLREATATACVGAGGIHVDASFETFLREHLKSRSNHPQFEAIISDSVDDFESHTKRSFRTNSTRSKVRVRIGAEWQLPDLNIQNGHLVLDRAQMDSFFDPAVNQILDAVRQQVASVGGVDRIILTGGFAESPYVKSRFRNAFQAVICPDDNSSPKPVALGALMLVVSGGLEIGRGKRRSLFQRWIRG